MGILLPKESYWDIPDTQKIKLDLLETTEFPDKDKREIPEESKVDDEIQAIKRNLNNREKEMKGIGLGLGQWKEDLLLYQGKVWIPNNVGIWTTLIAKDHDPPQAVHSGTAKTTELIS